MPGFILNSKDIEYSYPVPLSIRTWLIDHKAPKT